MGECSAKLLQKNIGVVQKKRGSFEGKRAKESEGKMRQRTISAKLRHQTLTQEACTALERERERILRSTGILKPRYEILSELVLATLGRGER